jgi:septal ring factor EnvC (AmiA/AmiB activator)
MDDFAASLTHLLSNVILPNLKAVQASQSEQIAANDRLEMAISELESHLNEQFAHMSAQLTACRAEIATLQATLQILQGQRSAMPIEMSKTVN